MKKHLILLFLFLGPVLFASQVVKVSKNKMGIAISMDMGSPLEVGQRVCVKNQLGKNYCGQIVKVKSGGAICKMESPVEGVNPGDDVSIEESLGSSSDSLSEGLESGPVLQDKYKKNKKNGMAFGFRGGLVLGRFSQSQQVEDENRKAINVGIFADINSGGGLFSFEPGLAFVQKGLETATYGNRLSYLDLTFLAKIRFSPGDFTPVFAVGPYFSYLLNAKKTTSSSEEDIKDTFKSIDLGALGMLGFEAKVAENTMVGLMGAYGLGLTNISAVSSIIGESESEVRNRTIQILLSLTLQL